MEEEEEEEEAILYNSINPNLQSCYAVDNQR
jgi:hypothetical protein